MNIEKIKYICKKYEITNYTINEDLSIDVDGDVYLSYRRLKEFPLKFRNVTGWFDCSDNNLTSLEGAPREVGGSFHCSSNSLTSLEGAPSFVVGVFYCCSNYLTSLEGGPNYVGGAFDCSSNYLETLLGVPNIVGGDFYCSGNSLISLIGAPSSVGGYFKFCNNYLLNNLIGFPKSIGSTSISKSIKSLDGIPLDLKPDNFKTWSERNKSYIKFEDYNRYCRNIKLSKILKFSIF